MWGLRILIAGMVLLAIVAVAFWLIAVWPLRNPHPALKLAKGTLAIEHAQIYVSPTEPVIPDGTVVIHDGLIAAVGANVSVPQDAKILPCDHCVVMAGFWNAHVHFTEPKWSMANWKGAAALDAQMKDMLTSRGFTTVVDTGSNPIDTVALRRRVEKGELDGPMIYTAGSGIYPPKGVPFYLRESMPGWMLRLLPQPATPQEAVNVVDTNLKRGADITKLFTGSWVERGKVLPMPIEVAKAAVERTHLNGRLVFSHPSSLAGTEIAIASGVDVLAHAPDDTEGIGPELFARMIKRNMAMIPTLKMFTTTVTSDPHYMDPIRAEIKSFHEQGGQLIFGTDVGYMSDYTTEGEFVELGRSGLNAMDVLAMLTVNPVSRLGVSKLKGTVTQGKLADLTVLDADPASDLTNFSKVRMTIRSGKVIWQH